VVKISDQTNGRTNELMDTWDRLQTELHRRQCGWRRLEDWK